jgi:hypothetical protein
VKWRFHGEESLYDHRNYGRVDKMDPVPVVDAPVVDAP